MPNLHVTDRQVMLYMTRSQQHDQESAAAMAGFSARTARRIDKDPRLPSQKRQPRTWRTRTDPLTDVWPRVLEMLKIPGMMAVTIFEDLQDEVGPEVFPDRVRRTLERRIARWRALHGEDKEVYFPQRHDPGRQALSDFTVTDSLGVTIAGEPFPHRLYHFRLACSGWEHVRVILGGESFSAVAEGLQDALWKLGGVPREHRTNSLSAAFKNLDRDAQLDFTKRYDELCRHYGMEATRNNPGVANENGSIEASNGHIKIRLDQKLRRRGSRDFDSLEAYRAFVDGVCERYNARRAKPVAAERETLKALPKRRTTDFAMVTAKVTRNSTINVDRVIYSVPSRLIGHKLEVHLFDDRLECFLGPDPVMRMTRVRTDRKRGHSIDYHSRSSGRDGRMLRRAEPEYPHLRRLGARFGASKATSPYVVGELVETEIQSRSVGIIVQGLHDIARTCMTDYYPRCPVAECVGRARCRDAVRALVSDVPSPARRRLARTCCRFTTHRINVIESRVLRGRGTRTCAAMHNRRT